MKRYEAVFFDWDGTAVLSRKAPADAAVAAMRPLLDRGTALVIVSGTTYENIAGGRIHECFSPKELQNLYLGLGRGAFDYAFDEAGQPTLLHDRTPDARTLLMLHRLCFDLHETLLAQYGFHTDIVFSRPNYCKIDLLCGVDRGDSLFLQSSEIETLNATLAAHKISEGIHGLIALAKQLGDKRGLSVQPTTDAKYLEVGLTTKSDNADGIFSHLQATRGFSANDCAFFGDEFVGVAEGLYGSDTCMITNATKSGGFFDVSDMSGMRPPEVCVLGGGVERFLAFLCEQSC